MRLGADSYHDGALTRLSDARHLRDGRRWAGATYLGGRAVECMFRALLWVHDRQQTVGHDLRALLKSARQIGMLSDTDVAFDDNLNEVAVVWHNNLRFVGEEGFLRHIKQNPPGSWYQGRPFQGSGEGFPRGLRSDSQPWRIGMASLQQKLKDILEAKLPDGQAELETLPNGHVVGDVISSSFDRHSYADRREMIRKVVDSAVEAHLLTPQEALNISTLLTYSPAEWNVTLQEG